jgi:hypothetical protein
VLNVPDYLILMRETIIHFFLYIPLVFVELGHCISLESLNPLIFSLYLSSYLSIKFSLPRQPLLLLDLNLVLYLQTLLLQSLQYLLLLLHALLPLLVDGYA